MEGNTNARKRIDYLKTLVKRVGIDPARVEMYNLSAAMGPRWAEICTEFTERIKKLGPSPIWLVDHKRSGKE
ncbi:MAG: hydrogenase iron-sulfur subunit [Proteobacteria bacterium]|nr:hydrogenase iron-sulfur subunit [Pseudomonadota bacterium]